MRTKPNLKLIIFTCHCSHNMTESEVYEINMAATRIENQIKLLMVIRRCLNHATFVDIT